MPELPEVETIKRLLNTLVKGKTIKDIQIYCQRPFLGGTDKFVKTLVGATFLNVTRKGKYLIFHFSNHIVVLNHLRMEGKYYEGKAKETPKKHDIFRYDFTDDTSLRYNDVRKFGVLILKNEQDYLVTPPLSDLGPEPWDVSFEEFYDRLQKKKKQPIKEALLDQTLIAGLGNIYANEVLFAAKINPRLPAALIGIEQSKKIILEAKRILEIAIQCGGSTIRSYHPKEGINGSMQTKLLVYGHANEPCPYCGFPLRKILLGERGTTYCPHCQPYPNRPLIVGVTGPIASGKSALSKMLSEKGYEIIDADNLVRDLYQKKEVIQGLTKRFGRNVKADDGINRSYLLKKITGDDKAKKALENYIHPLVYEEMEKRIEHTKSRKVVLDIPLLFGSPLEEKCDLIITIFANSAVQESRLILRGKNPKTSLLLNKKWPRGLAKRKSGIILDGSGSLTDLSHQLEKYSFL